MQRIMGGPKCPSVVPFEILHSERPFEMARFEHFGLEQPFNMVAMIVFTSKCPLEGDISHLECTVLLLLDFLFGLLQSQLCNYEMC